MDNINETTQKTKTPKTGLIIAIVILAAAIIAGAVWAVTSFVNLGKNPEEMTPQELLEYSAEKTFSKFDLVNDYIEEAIDNSQPVKDFYFGAEIDLSKADAELLEQFPEAVSNIKGDVFYYIDADQEDSLTVKAEVNANFEDESLLNADLWHSNEALVIDASELLGSAFGFAWDENVDFYDVLENSFLSPTSGSDYALDEYSLAYLADLLNTYNDVFTSYSSGAAAERAELINAIKDEFYDVVSDAVSNNLVGTVEKTEIDVNEEKLPVYEVKYIITNENAANIIDAIVNWAKASENVGELMQKMDYGMSTEEMWELFDEEYLSAVAEIRETEDFEIAVSTFIDQKKIYIVGFKVSTNYAEGEYQDIAVTVHINEKDHVKLGITVIDAEEVESIVIEYKNSKDAIEIVAEVLSPDMESSNASFKYDKKEGNFELVFTEYDGATETIYGQYINNDEEFRFAINDTTDTTIEIAYDKNVGDFNIKVVQYGDMVSISGKYTKTEKDHVLVFTQITADGERIPLDFITIKWGEKDIELGEIPEYKEILKYTAEEFDVEMISIYGALMGYIGSLPMELLMLLM